MRQYYSSDKKKREDKKRKKQEEKRLKRLARNTSKPDENNPVPAETPAEDTGTSKEEV
jgi:hypothetical protein